MSIFVILQDSEDENDMEYSEDDDDEEEEEDSEGDDDVECMEDEEDQLQVSYQRENLKLFNMCNSRGLTWWGIPWVLEFFVQGLELFENRSFFTRTQKNPELRVCRPPKIHFVDFLGLIQSYQRILQFVPSRRGTLTFFCSSYC